MECASGWQFASAVAPIQTSAEHLTPNAELQMQGQEGAVVWFQFASIWRSKFEVRSWALGVRLN
jgi:hypothetical protein